jgi:hypothetical protein
MSPDDKEFEFAGKISGEAPWWAKAPVWLAAGIVGVPSLIAIGAGLFIVRGVANGIRANREKIDIAVTTMHKLDASIERAQVQEDAHWKQISDYMGEQLRIELRSCIHASKTQKERDECLQISKRDMERLQKGFPGYPPDPPDPDVLHDPSR